MSNASTVMLLLAVLVIAVAALVPALPRVPESYARGSTIGVGAIIAVFVVIQVVSLLHPRDPLNLHVHARVASPPTARVLAVVACILAAGVVRRVSVRVALVGAAAVAMLVLGAWVLQAPKPRIDVLMFERVSAHTLAHGGNPYDANVVRFPDLNHGPNYGRGLTDGTVLKFGYPYPPLSLALVTISNELVNDPRRSSPCAWPPPWCSCSRSGGGADRRCLAAGAAAVLATSPSGWYIVKSGYIEPLVVLLLAVAVFCAARWPRGLPYAIGALVVAKQYAPLLLPLTTLIVPWRTMLRRSFLLPMIGTAAVCTVPALLARGFWRSVVVVQFIQPFRRDSLSFPAWWANHGHPEPSTALFFVPAVAAIVLCCRYAPRTPSSFAASSALVLLLFFAFAKQAFPNYYFLVIGALCVATAAYAGERTPELEAISAPPA